MAANIQARFYFAVDLRGNSHYQQGLSARISGFKLAASNVLHMLFILTLIQIILVLRKFELHS